MEPSKIIPIPQGRLSVDVVYKAKDSPPLKKSPSPEGTIGLHIEPPVYDKIQDETWRLMFAKHKQLVNNNKYLCDEYILGLDELKFPENRVPFLRDMSLRLEQLSGWHIIRVEGLVSPDNFFKLLANKLFPCSDFIRHIEEIDYTPAPDTFHDQVGHLPLITIPKFAEFFHNFGIAGANIRNETDLMWLNRIYWFTVEFGLINPTIFSTSYDPNQSRIYGAGISSSCGEIEYCFSPGVKRIPFEIETVINTEFDIHHMQGQLFEIESFDQLEQDFSKWARAEGFL